MAAATARVRAARTPVPPTTRLDTNRQEDLQKRYTNLPVDAFSKKATAYKDNGVKLMMDVAGQLEVAGRELVDVNDLIRLKKEELSVLGEIHDASKTLDGIKAESEALAAECVLRKQQVEEEILEMHKQAETTVAQQKAQGLAKLQHDYTIQKMKLEGELADAKQKHERALEAAMHEMQERESRLKEKETEFASLKSMAENAPKALQAEYAKAVGETTGRLKREYEHEAALKRMEHASELNVEKSKTASVQGELKSVTASLAQVVAENTRLHQTVSDLAGKALDAQSSRSALEAVERNIQQTQPANTTSARR